MTNEVAVKEVNLPSIAMYEEDAGLSSGIRTQDMAMPFLQILQPLSPQCDRSDPKYIPGAEAGMLVNTVTHDLFKGETDGVLVVPIFQRTTYIEWKTRESGGGFVRDHGEGDGEGALATSQKDDKGRDILPNGNQLVKTMTFVAALTDEDGLTFDPIVINFTSTQLKKARNWNTLISRLTRPDDPSKPLGHIIFAGKYRFKTVREQNDKGKWHGFHIESAGYAGASVYARAKELHLSLTKGTTKVDLSRAEGGEEVPF
jgi:hypothetical protein